MLRVSMTMAFMVLSIYSKAQETNPVYLNYHSNLDQAIYISSNGGHGSQPKMFFHLPWVGSTGNAIFEWDADDSGTKKAIYRFEASGKKILEFTGSQDGTKSELWFGDENDSKFIVSDNGNVGIGATSPNAKLVVSSSTTGMPDGNFSLGVRADAADLIQMVRSSVQTWNHEIDADGNYQLVARDQSDAKIITFKPDGNVGIGTISPDEKLTVNGTVKSREVIVEEDAGADFVFEEDYNLPSLQEIEAFVTHNNHLPGIAPASEMVENGVKVGELQMQLLQKIEELTLYVIELQKQIENLKSENN